MPAKATTVKEYLASLPADRRKAIATVRAVIRKNLDKKFKEGLQYGALGYFVPHSIYPEGYHCDPKQPLPLAGIASQKNHIGLYLFCVYGSPKLTSWFRSEWKKAGKKLDMGKSCVRVKTLDDIPLDVVAKLFKQIRVEDYIATYEASLPASVKKKRAGAKKKTAKKTVTRKKTAARAKTTRKPAARKKVTRKKVRRRA